MSRFHKAMTIFTVSFLGLWGCAQGPANSSSQADRIRALEAKCSRLEEDYRTVAVARDQARKQTSAMEQEKTQWEEDRTRLQKDLDQAKLVAKERDQLRQEVELKTSQRDVLQVRCEKMKIGLKNLLGDDDAMMNGTPAANSSAATSGGGR